MRYTLSLFIVCILAIVASGQSKADAEKAAILKVFNEYVVAMQAEQPERDRVRQMLLTEEYFYMGMDGLPAGKDHVMARQKRNGLRIHQIKINDMVIRLYGNTAILSMRSHRSGVDKGKPWGGDGTENGHTTVMVKHKGKWLIAADVVGVEIGK